MPEIDLRPGFCVFAVILAALDRSGAIVPLLGAMALHELGHLAVMLLCGADIRRVTLRFADLRIEAGRLSYRQEFFCALAGPLVNLCCALSCRAPAAPFAAASLVLGLYNLLPVWPLDGGRMLRCALCARLSPERAQRVCSAVSLAACMLLALAGLWLLFVRRAGVWPLGTAIYLIIRLFLLQKQA